MTSETVIDGNFTTDCKLECAMATCIGVYTVLLVSNRHPTQSSGSRHLSIPTLDWELVQGPNSHRIQSAWDLINSSQTVIYLQA